MGSLPPWNPFSISPPINQTVFELIFMSLGGLISLGTLFWAVVLLCGARTAAIKAKQPFLSFMAVVFSILWFLGAASTNGLFRQEEWMCLVFNFILYYFGMIGWISCLLVRLLILFLVYKLKFQKKYLPPSMFLVGLFLLPCVLALICASIWTDKFIIFDAERADCRNTWLGASVGGSISLPFIIGLIVLTCLNCRVRKEFNETRTEFFGTALLLIEFVFVLFCWVFRFNYLPPVKILTAFQSIFVELFYFWALNGYNIFKLITCQRKYFQKWEAAYAEHTMMMMEQAKIKNQLVTERLQHEKKVNSKNFFDGLKGLKPKDNEYHRMSADKTLHFTTSEYTDEFTEEIQLPDTPPQDPGFFE